MRAARCSGRVIATECQHDFGTVAPFERRHLSLIRVSFVQEPQSKFVLPNSARAVVGNGYQFYLPIFGWYSPTGTYTEGSGVRSDVRSTLILTGSLTERTPKSTRR